MSVMDRIPSDLPFEVDLAERPVSFQFGQSWADAAPAVLLSLVWIVVGPVLIITITSAGGDMYAAGSTGFWIQVVLCGAYLVWAIFFYFGPEILSQLTRTVVTIESDDVTVSQHTLFGDYQWSLPLTAFDGVRLRELGLQDIDGEKQDAACVELVHGDQNRCIPLVIRERKQIGLKTVKRVVDELDLPVLETVHVTPPEDGIDGAVVVNRFQAWKVRWVYRAIVVASLAGAGASLYALSFGNNEPALWVAILICVAFAVAIHVYTGCYITKLRLVDGVFYVQTAAPWNNEHKWRRQNVKRVTYQSGEMRTPTLWLDTPWVSLWLDGERLPYVIDMQAEFVDRDVLAKLAQDTAKR